MTYESYLVLLAYGEKAVVAGFKQGAAIQAEALD